jgi:hypothetical protein
MPRFRPLRCLLLPVIAAAVLPVVAEAAQTLAEAIRQADAKYLKVRELETKPTTPNIEAGSGEEETAHEHGDLGRGHQSGAQLQARGGGRGGYDNPRGHNFRRR